MKLLLMVSFLLLMTSCDKVESLRSAKGLPDKDPNDFTLTSNSTKWETDRYCPVCFKTVVYSESMSDICSDCGTPHRNTFWDDYRSFRKIVRNEKWIWQYRYRDEESVLSTEQIHQNIEWSSN